MFTDIQIARRSALALAKTLMVPTVVISAGQGFAVIPADELRQERAGGLGGIAQHGHVDPVVGTDLNWSVDWGPP